MGLCAGLHLANLGVPFMIFEDDGGLSTEPKAGVLLPSSLEILSQLGVAEQILGEGVRCGTVQFLDGVSARVVNRMHLHELHTDTRYPMGLNLAQNDTERILRDAICAHGLESALHFRHRVFAPPGDIHRVANPAPDPALSLHVYGADLRDGLTSVRRVYDLPVQVVGNSA
ncbi:MAG: 3-(3-hydroxy-phenyl)propionate hydroxylase, partial [Pseudonocardiales bacterium]|nr:3-(3-hydroxy-phenyl)propionate hydroxylase [Pseudonocardiales bacterium]